MITWETPIEDFDSIEWDKLNGENLLTALEIYCTKKGASDIHTSPERSGVRLEIRLHGVLLPLMKLEHSAYEDFVRRIKFISKLKLNITDTPQDGQYVCKAPDRIINIRVASIPSKFGESFTLRLLDPKRGIVPLESLGFPKIIAEKFKELVSMPHGLILVTGPTGSGKTTTLYALLNEIAEEQKNIITLEDPIEYELDGIVQTAVDPNHDYDFSNGLRSILRQDPDVILVGEIRDVETAKTAINAALTGHLVLSTLHTNSAVEAIQRLLSMGVTNHTLAPALKAVMGQRLVRTLKSKCKEPDSKCDPADHNSYDGVTAVPELLIENSEIESEILNESSSEAIEKKIKESGYMTVKEWGQKLVKNGTTSQEEISRVMN
ncbi:type II/IV secretion system protein [Candidatus Peregrinibacteria bacterium]|nr:type II/IV secretion system protein [Candidatus Peregrinibacteria bacterium]